MQIANLNIETKTARYFDRAVLLWGLGLIAEATLSLIGENHWAALLAATAIPLLPTQLTLKIRTALIVISVIAVLSGPIALIIAVSAAIFIAGLRTVAQISLLSLTSVALLAHHVQSIPNVPGLHLHLASVAFVVIPTLICAICFASKLHWKAITWLIVSPIVLITTMNAGAGRWITTELLSSETFWILLVLLLALVAANWAKPFRDAEPNGGTIWLVLGLLAGVAAALLVTPIIPIKSVVFDEAHGKWETIKATFGPNDFGRSANYTYSLLARYASAVTGDVKSFDHEKDNLPETDAAFVLKMPSTVLSNQFSSKLERWVRAGGRLLIIADHTDLYDSTQNLNNFISSSFGIRINSDAVFDPLGMPNVTKAGSTSFLLGRIDTASQPFAWQTGASLSRMPANAVELATFGNSFTGQGDYSAQNRFGSFTPRVFERFTKHTAVAAFGVGRGAVAIITDSTPWSNFSIFKDPYKHLFRGILHALANPIALEVLGWGSIILGLVTVILTFYRPPLLIFAGGLMLGLVLGAGYQIGKVSLDPQVEGRDFGLKVRSGGSTKFEFLSQLVGPGERNFSRIVSSMSKFGLAPSASTPGEATSDLKSSKKWLLLQPDDSQLPDSNTVINHLRAGGDLTILFSPDQAANPGVRVWLTKIGLHLNEAVALALTEDNRPGQMGFLDRRGAALMRDTRPVTMPISTGLLLSRETDQLIQSYGVRPTVFPRTSGLLNVGFSADQFSDTAIGEVWEGINPASIGRLRERQLAAALMGTAFPGPFPESLGMSNRNITKIDLSAYLILEDGRVILNGKFDGNISPRSFAATFPTVDDPVAYLKDLQLRSVDFIQSYCPKSKELTQCNARMLGPDTIEWMVSWASKADGSISAIELLHERTFSGLGKTVNVVFSE